MTIIQQISPCQCTVGVSNNPDEKKCYQEEGRLKEKPNSWKKNWRLEIHFYEDWWSFEKSSVRRMSQNNAKWPKKDRFCSWMAIVPLLNGHLTVSRPEAAKYVSVCVCVCVCACRKCDAVIVKQVTTETERNDVVTGRLPVNDWIIWTLDLGRISKGKHFVF